MNVTFKNISTEEFDKIFVILTKINNNLVLLRG
jgi:hypothetical protein